MTGWPCVASESGLMSCYLLCKAVAPAPQPYTIRTSSTSVGAMPKLGSNERMDSTR
jgi:hypothetical protein